MDVETVVEVTPEQAESYLKAFKARFPEYYDERTQYSPGDLLTALSLPPEPKQGGTFCYCPQLIPFEIPRLDKLGRRTRYKDHVDRPCNRKFRRTKAYRRHWRRSHLPGLTEA